MKNILNFLLVSHIKVFFLFLTIMFFGILYFTLGMSLWLLGYLAISFLSFYFFFLFHGGMERTLFLSIVIVVIPVVLGLSLFFFVEKKDSVKKETVSEVLTPEECKPIYEKYNGKLLDIKSDGLIGRADVEINPDDCKATVSYVFQFTASLEKNNLDSAVSSYWGYFAEYPISDDRKTWSGSGEIFPVFQNVRSLPEVGEESHEFYGYEADFDLNITEFYHWFSRTYVFSDEKYENLFKRNRYVIIDGREYIEEVETGGMTFSGSLNTDLAAPVAPIVKEFKLNITER
jgi:hypothetical protein